MDELAKSEENEDPSNINEVIKLIKKDNLNNGELLSSLSRYIQKGDKELQNLGAIYDKTGYSGLKNLNINNLPIDIVQRMILRAKSTAFLFVSIN